MNRTKIEYLTYTWSPMVGCSGVNCAVREKCWARAQAKRQIHCEYCVAFQPHFHEERLNQPLEVKKAARIGTCFSGEYFDKQVKREWQARIENIVNSASWHTFFILTKQPQNIPGWLLYPNNLWIGVSVNRLEDLWRIEELKRRDNIAHKFASFEPLYEAMNNVDLTGLEWVIIGAQTRPDLQPKIAWVKDLMIAAMSYKCKVFLKNNLKLNFKRLQELP